MPCCDSAEWPVHYADAVGNAAADADVVVVADGCAADAVNAVDAVVAICRIRDMRGRRAGRSRPHLRTHTDAREESTPGSPDSGGRRAVEGTEEVGDVGMKQDSPLVAAR